MFDIKPKIIKGSSYKIYFREKGKGTPFIMIHGLLASGFDFYYQFKYFSKKYRCIAPDLPGFGIAYENQKSNFTQDRCLKNLEIIVNKIGKEGIILLGHSYGSLIALKFALNNKEKISKLILADFTLNIKNKLSTKIFIFLFPILKYFVSDKFIKFYSLNINIKRENRREDLEEVMIERIERGKDSYYMQLQAMQDYLFDLQKENLSEEHFNNFDVPTLLVAGGEDYFISKSELKKFHNKLKNSSLVFIKNSRHCPMYERPEDFNKVLEKFIK